MVSEKRVVKDPMLAVRERLEEEGLSDTESAALRMAAEASPETARRALEGPPKPALDPAKFEQSYTFHFSFMAENGAVFEGELTNKILTVKERRIADIMAAQMGGGVPFESLPPARRLTNSITAHLSLSLQRPRPKWLDFDTLLDEDVIYALWKEVSSHEETFFGPR